MNPFKYINSCFVILIGLLALSVSFPADAEIVSQKEAKNVARLFFNDAYSNLLPDPIYVYNGKKLTTDRLFTPFYVFNSPEGGFVIVSADNKAFPILGYQLALPGMGFPKSGPSDAEETSILRNFARDIELIRFDARFPTDAASAWEDLPQTIHDILYPSAPLADNYYRYRTNDDKVWVLRERAVEFPYEWPKTDEELKAERLAGITPEYVPFSFYDDFVNETRSNQEAKMMALEERLNPSKPVVRNLGGAHFAIDTPREIAIYELYNAEGALMTRRFYRGGRQLPVDLSLFPSGFYIARIEYKDGSSDGLKLYR